MENVIIRNIEEKDIPSVVDIQISGWQIAYKGKQKLLKVAKICGFGELK